MRRGVPLGSALPMYSSRLCQSEQKEKDRERGEEKLRKREREIGREREREG